MLDRSIYGRMFVRKPKTTIVVPIQSVSRSMHYAPKVEFVPILVTRLSSRFDSAADEMVDSCDFREQYRITSCDIHSVTYHRVGFTAVGYC